MFVTDKIGYLTVYTHVCVQNRRDSGIVLVCNNSGVGRYSDSRYSDIKVTVRVRVSVSCAFSEAFV